jgi:ribosomal protein L32
MSSWSGSKCPSCGLTCRPHHLTNLSDFLVDGNNKVIGHYTAFDGACNYIKCKGEKD